MKHELIFNPKEFDMGKEIAEFISGILTALLLNSLLILLTMGSSILNLNPSPKSYIDILPWVLNGLFLLVFLLIMPRFALGYLLGIAVLFLIPFLFLAIPFSVGEDVGEAVLLAGCFIVVLVGMVASVETGLAVEKVLPSYSDLILFIIIGSLITIGLVMLYKRKKVDE